MVGLFHGMGFKGKLAPCGGRDKGKSRFCCVYCFSPEKEISTKNRWNETTTFAAIFELMKENSKGPLNAFKNGNNNAKSFRDPARVCTVHRVKTQRCLIEIG